MLYITNDTKQNWVLQYRRYGGEGGQLLGPFTSQIPSGSQIELGRDWPEEDVHFLVRQLEGHGAIESSQLDRQVRRHTGLQYRFERPVTADKIEQGHDKVVESQQKRSAEEATKAALGFDHLANQLGRGRRRVARMTEVEVEQLHDPRGRPTGDEIHFKLGVDTEGNEPVSLTID